MITDIRLPGMTGLELIHQLRARFPADDYGGAQRV